MDIDAEQARVQDFVDKGNYHAALNIAVSALNDCRRHNDQAGVDIFIVVINEIARTMEKAFGSNKTSDT
jgi:hypothetical protein